MAYTIGTPVVSAKIVVDGADSAFDVAIGDSIMVTVQNCIEVKEYTGTVLAIELGNKPFFGKREHAVYDGVPTSTYNNPVCAMISNAADVMDVNALLIEVSEEVDPDGDGPEEAETIIKHVRIPVGRIKTIEAGT